MVHQHFRLVEPFTVAENVALGDQRERKLVPDRARARAARRRARRAVRPRRRSARAHLAALGRRAAARRDPQGAAPRRARADPRRADRRAHPAGGARRSSRRCARWPPTAARSSSSRTSCTRCSRSPTASPCCAAGASSRPSPAAGATPEALAALMVGREVEQHRRRPSAGPRGDVVLEAHDLHAEGDRGLPALRGVSLAVRARRDRRRRGRRRQRPARARRGAHRAAAADLRAA